jgi:hypothetical protein
MSRGKRRPGSANNGAEFRAKDSSSAKSFLEPGVSIEESKLASLVGKAFDVVAIFIIFGTVSITWVILAGKPAAELVNFLDTVAIPLIALVAPVLRYYFRSQYKTSCKRHVDRC